MKRFVQILSVFLLMLLCSGGVMAQDPKFSDYFTPNQNNGATTLTLNSGTEQLTVNKEITSVLEINGSQLTFMGTKVTDVTLATTGVTIDLDGNTLDVVLNGQKADNAISIQSSSGTYSIINGSINVTNTQSKSQSGKVVKLPVNTSAENTVECTIDAALSISGGTPTGVQVVNGTKVTVDSNGSIITSGSNDNAVYLYNRGEHASEGTTQLIMNKGAQLQSYAATVATYGSDPGAVTIQMNGSTVTSTGGPAFYLANGATGTKCTIDNGTVTGAHDGICIRGGGLIVNGGSITGNGTFNGNNIQDQNEPAGTINNGAGILVATPGGYGSTVSGYGNVSVNIAGGTISSAKGYALQGTVGTSATKTVWKDANALSITGGTFNVTQQNFPILINNMANEGSAQITTNPAPTTGFITPTGTQYVTFNQVNTPANNPGTGYFGDSVTGAVLTASPKAGDAQEVIYCADQTFAKTFGIGYVAGVNDGVVSNSEQTTATSVLAILASTDGTPTFYNADQQQTVSFDLTVIATSGIANATKLNWTVTGPSSSGINNAPVSTSTNGLSVNRNNGNATLTYTGTGLTPGIYTLTATDPNGGNSAQTASIRFTVDSANVTTVD